MGQINTNNYPTVDSLADADLLIVENAAHGTGTTTPKQLRENAIGTDSLQTSAQTVTGAINELKTAIDAGSDVKCYDIDTISSGYLGEFDGKAKILLLHLTADGTADATNGYTMLLSYTRPVARLLYGQLVDSEGVAYKQDIYAENTIICEVTNNGVGTESDPCQVVILGITNAAFTLTPTAVVSDRDIIDGQGNTLSVLAEALTKTASGNPVVISDCAGGKARSLKTTIEALQDLHGYDHPWAGGAGKNKLPMTVSAIKAANTGGTWSGNVYTINGGTITVLTDSDGNVTGFKVNGTFNNVTTFNIAVISDLSVFNGMVVNGNPITSAAVAILRVEMEKSPWTGYSESNNADTTIGQYDANTQGSVFIRVFGGQQVSNQTISPMLRLSTESDASFAPWENKCPISGRTEVRVDDVGKNKVETPSATAFTARGITLTTASNGETTLNGTSTAGSIDGDTFELPAGTYTISVGTTLPSGVWISLDGVPGAMISPTGKSISFTTTEAISTFTHIYVNAGVVFNNFKLNWMLEVGSTATPYAPYQHSSATIQLGQTVYGAEVDFDTGVARLLDVKEVLTDISQLYGNAPNISSSGNWMGMQISSLPLIEAANINLKCSIAKPVSYNNRTAGDVVGTDRTYIDSDPNGVIILRLSNEFSDITTKADFFAHFTGAEVCYELTTPTTLQLTPAQLQMLKGYNRVSIDNGTIEIGYIAKLT